MVIDALRILPAFHPTHLVVHYDEIALKGKNRGQFEERLAENIRASIRDLGKARVRRLYGRIAVILGEEIAWTRAAERISRVFGVAYLMPARTAEPTVEAMRRAVEEVVAGETAPRTFAIRCRRANKELPFTSMDLQRELGTRVQEVTGWSVDLKRPELSIRVELVNQAAYLAIGRLEGPGGLPTGAAGRVVSLLSGGIDSPVAAYRILCRGAQVTYVHFHSYPHTGLESQEKVRELAAIIQPHGLPGRLYEIPFAELQREIVARAPPPLRVVLYRRFMVRTAEAIARRIKALALVTGESLGQVASQTLENLRTIDAVAQLPILRPVIGWDKLQIVNEAKRIGTFDVSIEPHDDCCSFLMPPNPATRSRPKDLEVAEEALDVNGEVAKLVDSAQVHEILSQ